MCRQFWIFLLCFSTSDFVLGRTRTIRNLYGQRCANRLESALDTTLRRSQQRSGSSSIIDFSDNGPSHRPTLFDAAGQRSPFSSNNYNEEIQQIVSEYKHKLSNPSSSGSSPSYFQPSSSTNTLAAAQVEVANLRVRIPQNHHWVVVDRCQFIEHNRTLDTKLEFPDLQISGRVIMHPSGGRCDMILRLRRAGIEFRTIPLIPSGVGERSRQANVRTDSHFSEPGFISVFAHSCEGPSGIKYRINSKRRHFFNRQPVTSPSYYGRDRRRSLDYLDEDLVANNDGLNDVFKLNDGDALFLSPSTFVNIDGEDQDGFGPGGPSASQDPNSRTFFAERNPFSYSAYGGPPNNYANEHTNPDKGWQNVETNEALDDAYSNEIDNLFSKGVRGLLTTYMQKALQPAIKETLMESMGYTLSYG
uniref:VWFD domain-containing protein n=1 Tax=Anopheles funestus TaxID=62324 RepID=A0A182RRR4_ANOFN